jgi:hypothetical protein
MRTADVVSSSGDRQNDGLHNDEGDEFKLDAAAVAAEEAVERKEVRRRN